MAESGVLNGLDDELKRSDVVRLRGLPFSATESDVAAFFKGLDLGRDGIVICVNFQGRSTGQAYVQFASTEQANKALDRNRQHIGSRYIEVFKGHPADMEGALRMAGRVGPGPTVNDSGGILGTGIPGMAGNPDMRFTGVVRMRGMPYSCTSADIIAFFKGMPIAPDGIFICSHADGRPTGEAFVEFVNEETSSRAMQLHREPMGSRYIELFRSSKGEMMTAVQRRMWFLGVGSVASFGVLGQMPGMMGAFGTTGLNAATAGRGDASEHVYVKLRGLPYNAGQGEIKDFFEGYNIVPSGIHIVMGATDRPTGEAFVEFVTPKEAQRAMERHRQNIGSRYIELFRATKSEMMAAIRGPSTIAVAQPDPTLQILLLQQQAAAANAFGLLGVQASGAWTEMQNAATAMYQRQIGLASSGLAFDPAAATAAKLRTMPYRSST